MTTIAFPANTFQPLISTMPVAINNGLVSGFSRISNNIGLLMDLSIWLIKRTWQPSIVKRKRKHGFLARLRNRHGRKIIKRRKQKGRTRICV